MRFLVFLLLICCTTPTGVLAQDEAVFGDLVSVELVLVDVVVQLLLALELV